MWNDSRIHHDLYLAHMRGKCLFELRPDLFPQGTMTDTERSLWAMFFDEIKERRETK